MAPINILNIALSAVCYVSFTYGIPSIFKIPSPMPTAVRWLSVVGTLATLAQFWALTIRSPSLGTEIVGSSMFVACLLLFWWAGLHIWHRKFGIAFAPDQGVPIVTTGPYRWIRHPFYASYMLYWIAGAVATAEPLLLITLVVMCLFFYIPAIRREETELMARPDGATYREYRANTGLLVPSLWKLRR